MDRSVFLNGVCSGLEVGGLDPGRALRLLLCPGVGEKASLRTLEVRLEAGRADRRGGLRGASGEEPSLDSWIATVGDVITKYRCSSL